MSPAGGIEARWRRDGTELFYISADRKLIAVPVTLGKSFERGAPRELFSGVPFVSYFNRYFSYQPSADGQRFLGLVPGGKDASATPLTVVVNWMAGLKR
jgi:hypothetical protein